MHQNYDFIILKKEGAGLKIMKLFAFDSLGFYLMPFERQVNGPYYAPDENPSFYLLSLEYTPSTILNWEWP